MPTGAVEVHEVPSADSVPSTGAPPDSWAVTEVSLPWATLTEICAAGSTFEVFGAGVMTRTAGPPAGVAEDCEASGGAPDEAGAPADVAAPGGAEDFADPSPPHAARTRDSAEVATARTSLRIGASEGDSNGKGRTSRRSASLPG